MNTRFLAWFLRCSAVAGLAVLASCADPISDAPQFETTDCRRIGLVDLETGELVVGAEDIAVDFYRNRIFVSAYDRRAAESAARKKAFSIPQGGLYSIPVEALRSNGERLLPVSSFVDRAEISGGLRPHGIDFDAASNEIAFINRGYQSINRKWRMSPRLERVGANGERFIGETAVSPCSANDVLVDRGSAFISFDHGSCGADAALETFFGLKRSGIADQEGEKLFDSALFANGLAYDASGRVALAATREKSIHFFEPNGNMLDRGAKLVLAGGPDNLSVSPSGSIIAAVHPSMIKLALHRKLGMGLAPSRIVEIAPDGKSASTLFDDPGGETYSAATVGVLVDDLLILGSATDSGLLVCEQTENEVAPRQVAKTISSPKTLQ